MSGWANAGRGSTRQSRAVRARVLKDFPTCYLQYPGCTGDSTQDDHVIPLSQGGSDDYSNHAGACGPCHKVKSQREAIAGRTVQRVSLKLPTEEHPSQATRRRT